MGEVATLPGLKEDELRALGPCALCGQPLLARQGTTFYRVRLERAIFEIGALRRRAGLELMVGPLARALSSDEDLAHVCDGPVEVAVHEDCAGSVGHLLRLFPSGGSSDEALAKPDPSFEASAGGEAE